MTDDEQRAASVKYSSALVWHFAEISPGLFALYNSQHRRTQLITTDWEKVLEAYRERPEYVPPMGAEPGGTGGAMGVQTPADILAAAGGIRF